MDFSIYNRILDGGDVKLTQSREGSHSRDQETHGSLKSYVVGFLLSILLTVLPLLVVVNKIFQKNMTLMFVLVMASMQFFVQLHYFMHVKEEKKPRWNIMALVMGAVIMLTIVTGSIWIMLYNAVEQ